MPCEVERGNRDTPVDHAHVGQFGGECGRSAILPRAREHRDVVAAGPRQRARHLVDVLADAGAGSQGRSVIDDDPHAAEPITTRPYPCWSMGWKDILASAASRGETSRMKIAVVGSGYVGLVLGACLAENGNDVTCIDKDASKVRSLRRGVMPIYEPGLEEMVKRNRAEKRLEFTTDLPRAVRSRQHRLHCRRHAAARRRIGRSLARARRCARYREVDERLQGDRRQEHGAGGHGRARARADAPRDITSLQRRQQS